MPYLNGKRVSDKEISPTEHKLIGTFRDPSFKTYLERVFGKGGLKGIIMCSCGRALHTIEATYLHWQQGHFDELIYEKIKERIK